MTSKQLRDELKSFMKEHGKTTVDVASMAHVSPSTVKRFVDGETDKPHPIVHRALTEVLMNQTVESAHAANKKHSTVS